MTESTDRYRLTVRRLAALDLWGRAGSERRRRMVRLELWVAAVGCGTLGVLFVRAGATWELICGAYLWGIALNYLALAVHVESLRRAGRLESEIAKVTDINGELRRATKRQLLLLVPLVIAVEAVIEHAHGQR